MSLLLHQGRSALLRQIPKGAEVFLSAGCAGNWFFDWIADCYGPLARHIGLEYYMPRPADLPENVEWIANTCSDMSAIENMSCDIVFSGQNLEHLWPNEAVGFLLEAARVTRPGGLLVMDSPNRKVTEAWRNWSHPEHTVELATAEAVEVAELAGFDVTAVKGIWLCRDSVSGALLPFQNAEECRLSIPERLVGGVCQPDDAFIWWIEARRTVREPDRLNLERRYDEIFRLAWPERLTRMAIGIGRLETDVDGPKVVCPADSFGPVIYGPYAPLRPGRYRCVFYLEAGEANARARCDVTFSTDANVLASYDIEVKPYPEAISIEFSLKELTFGIEFRCFSLGGGGFKCRPTVDLLEL